MSHRDSWLCQGSFYARGTKDSAETSSDNTSAPKQAQGYFIIDRFKVSEKSITHAGFEYPLLKNSTYFWDDVRGKRAILRCREVNRARIQKWERNKDDVPM
jgi:hypothetical protein